MPQKKIFALFLLFSPLFAHAAGFDCGKARNAAERTICADKRLSKLDTELANEWQQALQRTVNSSLLKDDQRSWLRQRDACKSDKRCLRTSYLQRQRQLRQKEPVIAADTFHWTQTWLRAGKKDSKQGANLVVAQTAATRIHFTAEAWSAANTGRQLAGDMALRGDGRASYTGRDGCRLDFRPNGHKLIVLQQGMCGDVIGQGAAIKFAGTYLDEASDHNPSFDPGE
jgi:uncharacterized protein